MKTKLFLAAVLCLGVFAGCSSSDKKEAAQPAKAEAVKKSSGYREAYALAIEENRACKQDSDCASVPAGCCLCDGNAAVSQSSVEGLNALRAQLCSKAICTLQMCYMDIDVSCKNKKCTGKLKENQGMFLK